MTKPLDPDIAEALQHLHSTWRELYLEGPPYTDENIRRREAICDKIRKWSQ